MAKVRENGKKGQVRQGDVLLMEETAPVQELERRQPTERGVVIAEGELTGHAHLIDPSTAYEFKGKSSRGELGTRFLRTEVDTELRHEGIGEPGDHEPIALKEKKVYRIRKQVELNPAGLPIPVRD